MKKKIRLTFAAVVMTFLFSIVSTNEAYAGHWFGWHSNNDCVVVATPSDSHNVSACIGGTETYYFLGIKFSTRASGERYGYVN